MVMRRLLSSGRKAVRWSLLVLVVALALLAIQPGRYWPIARSAELDVDALFQLQRAALGPEWRLQYSASGTSNSLVRARFHAVAIFEPNERLSTTRAINEKITASHMLYQAQRRPAYVSGGKGVILNPPELGFRHADWSEAQCYKDIETNTVWTSCEFYARYQEYFVDLEVPIRNFRSPDDAQHLLELIEEFVRQHLNSTTTRYVSPFE